MKQKKAEMEVQFNWIFILVVGAIILIFFITVVYSQKKGSEEKLNIKVLTDIDAIITTAQVGTKTAHLLTIPKLDIRFECTEDCLCEYFVRGAASRKQYRDKIIFSQNYLQGTRLVTWSYDWNLGFRIMNFLYLTNPQVRYVIYDNPLDDPNFAEELDKTLPDESNKEVVESFNGFTDKNNYKVRFIFFDESGYTNNVDSIYDLTGNVTAVVIKMTEHDEDDILNGYGTVTYYDSEDSDGTIVNFIGKASLLGTILNEYPEGYNCQMNNAIKRLNYIADVYSGRAEALTTSVSNPDCKQLVYDPARGNIEAIKSLNIEDPINVGNVYAKIKSLKGVNKAAQLYSCPLVY